jgi:hypothetical protein
MTFTGEEKNELTFGEKSWIERKKGWAERVSGLF